MLDLSIKRVIALFLSVPLLFSFSSIVYAANAMIEEVVVTARKQEESAQDVPIAITALVAELENSSVRNLTDVNGYIRGLGVPLVTRHTNGFFCFQILSRHVHMSVLCKQYDDSVTKSPAFMSNSKKNIP